MCLIYVKAKYEVCGKVHFPNSSEETEKSFSFTVPTSSQDNVTVNIFRPEKNKPLPTKIEALSPCVIYEQMLNFLQERDKKGGVFPKCFPGVAEEQKKNILDKKRSVELAVKKVVGLIKYYLEQSDIDESLIHEGKWYWSSDKEEWSDYTEIRMIPRGGFLTYRTFNKKNVSEIQKKLSNNVEPFTALQFLHKAIRESEPRYKLINAAIAAETAIKEFFLIKEEKIGKILLRLPSPPLAKMYGDILKDCGLEKYPKVNEIRMLSEIRNQLIHKPSNFEIKLDKKTLIMDEKMANKYIDIVKDAIEFLASLLPEPYHFLK